MVPHLTCQTTKAPLCTTIDYAFINTHSSTQHKLTPVTVPQPSIIVHLPLGTAKPTSNGKRQHDQGTYHPADVKTLHKHMRSASIQLISAMKSSKNTLGAAAQLRHAMSALYWVLLQSCNTLCKPCKLSLFVFLYVCVPCSLVLVQSDTRSYMTASAPTSR